MSYTITNNIMYVRDDTGELVPVSMIASDAKEAISAINTTAENAKNEIDGKVNDANTAIETKTNEQVARIPEVTTLAQDVDVLKNKVKSDVVQYGSVQTLSDAQKAQARGNIDAADAESVDALKGDLVYVIERTPSINLYSPEIAMPGYYMYQAGTLGKNESITFSGYVPCGGLENVTITLFGFAYPGTANQYCFYDASKNPIDGRKSGKPINGQASTIAVPTNAQFIGFQWKSIHGTESTVMVEGGTVGSSSFVPYGDIVTVLPSDETKNARGEYDNLGERLNAIDSGSKKNKNVTYWGDSLTQGNQDGTGISRPSVMKSLLGDAYTVNNFGVGGEKSNAIASRQGGMNIVLNPGITIPGDGSYVTVGDYITDNWGNHITFGSCIYGEAYNAYKTVNPCYVDGVACTLYKDNQSAPVQIKQNAIGSNIDINRPTTIVTNGSKSYRNHIVVIWVGQNQGFNISNPQELVEQIKAIIEWNGTDKYIVIGLGYETYIQYAWQIEVNKALKLAFGRHYIDVGAYMRTPIYDGDSIVSSYAMDDCGLTPTADELAQIEENHYPSRLLASDGFHFSQYGYTVIANLEYKRGKELGYW